MGWSNIVSTTNSQEVAEVDAASNCPICECRLTDDVARCPRCNLVYHYPCWSLAAGCPSCGYDTKRLLPSGAAHLSKRLSLLSFLTSLSCRIHSSVWLLALLFTISIPILGQSLALSTLGFTGLLGTMLSFSLDLFHLVLPLMWIFVVVSAVPLGFLYRHLMKARTRWPGRLPAAVSSRELPWIDSVMARIPLWLGLTFSAWALFNVLYGLGSVSLLAHHLLMTICFVVAPCYITHLLLAKRVTMLSHIEQYTKAINRPNEGIIIGTHLPRQRPTIALPISTLPRHNLEKAARCPVCGCDVQHRAVLCPTCDTPHHHDCWEYTGNCSIFGCPGVHGEKVTEVKPEPRMRSISSMAIPAVGKGSDMVQKVDRWLFALKGHFVSFVAAVLGIQLLLWSRVLPTAMVKGDAVISTLALWAPSFSQGGLVLTIIGLLAFLIFTWQSHRKRSLIEDELASSNRRPITTRNSFELAATMMNASFVGLVTWTLAWAFVIPVMAANQPAAWSHQLTLVDMVAFIAVGILLPLLSLNASKSSVNKAQQLQKRLSTYVPRIGRRRTIN